MKDIEMSSPETLYLNKRINELEEKLLEQAKLNMQLALKLLAVGKMTVDNTLAINSMKGQGFDAMEALSIFNEKEKEKLAVNQ